MKPGSGNPCEIDLEIDLVGVQPTVATGLRPGDLLTVELALMPPAISVVCKSSKGEVAGSVSAFLGLTQLISCIQKGVEYRAMVLTASSTRCTVIVRLAGAF